jgi:sulfonate transport system ATP-binding protein
VLLLDEPFSALDEGNRAALESLVLDLQRREAVSLVLVTHDLDDVIRLAHRIVLLGGSPTRVAGVVEASAGLTSDALRSRLVPLGG